MSTPARKPATRKPASKPQDRKPPQPKVVDINDGKTTVTVRGITVTVLKDALDDFELLDDFAGLEQRNAAKLATIMRRLVGDSWGQVMDGLRGDNGRVSVDDAGEFIMEVMEAIAPNS